MYSILLVLFEFQKYNYVFTITVLDRLATNKL